MNQITPSSFPLQVHIKIALLDQTFFFSHLEIDKPTRSFVRNRHNRLVPTDSPMQSHGDACSQRSCVASAFSCKWHRAARQWGRAARTESEIIINISLSCYTRWVNLPRGSYVVSVAAATVKHRAANRIGHAAPYSQRYRNSKHRYLPIVVPRDTIAESLSCLRGNTALLSPVLAARYAYLDVSLSSFLRFMRRGNGRARMHLAESNLGVRSRSRNSRIAIRRLLSINLIAYFEFCVSPKLEREEENEDCYASLARIFDKMRDCFVIMFDRLISERYVFYLSYELISWYVFIFILIKIIKSFIMVATSVLRS